MSAEPTQSSSFYVEAYADPWLQIDRVFPAPAGFVANPESEVLGLMPLGG